MGCFAIMVLAYKVLKVSYENTPGSPFFLFLLVPFWSLFYQKFGPFLVPFRDFFLQGPNLGTLGMPSYVMKMAIFACFLYRIEGFECQIETFTSEKSRLVTI